MSWNAYTRFDKRRATKVAAYLIQEMAKSEYLTLADLPGVVSRFDLAAWRAVSFAALGKDASYDIGEAAKNYCVAILLKQAQSPLPVPGKLLVMPPVQQP